MKYSLDDKLSDTEEIALTEYVHTPQDTGAALVKFADKIYGTHGISLGNALLDLFIPPNIPGWTRVLMARPGEFKSTVLRITAKHEAVRIKREGLTDKCVIIVTYEEAVDTQAMFFVPKIDKENFWQGKVSPQSVEAAVLSQEPLDIYFIGESMLKNKPNKSPMSVNMVMAGIIGIMKQYGKTPTIVLWDYIQETHVDREARDRKQKIIDAMGDVIRMCINLGIPIDIASQAKQTSMEHVPWPIPIKGDSEYSFYPEQKGTIGVGIWKPWETHRNDPLAQNNGIRLPGWKHVLKLQPNLAVFQSTKSRYRMQTKSIPVLVDPVNLVINDIPEIRQEMERWG